MTLAIFSLAFQVAGADAEPLPQCVMSTDLLANDSMKPCKLKCHLETEHPTLKDKPLTFFQMKVILPCTTETQNQQTHLSV